MILKLCAYLIRAAGGLDNSEPVILAAGAESVRAMALNAKDHMDHLRLRVSSAENRGDAYRTAAEAAATYRVALSKHDPLAIRKMMLAQSTLDAARKLDKGQA